MIKITGVKSFSGMEGLGYNATIRINGKIAGILIDDATGGEAYINYKAPFKREDVIKECKPLVDANPIIKFEDGHHIENSWLLELENMAIDFIDSADVRRICNRVIAFNVKGDTNDGSYRTFTYKQFPQPTTKERIHQLLIKRYGVGNYTVLNDTYGYKGE